jgi:hypothetical protein
MPSQITPAEASVQTRISGFSGLPTRLDAVTAYTVLRIALGFAMFMHGFARFIGGLDIYAHRYIAGFAGVALLSLDNLVVRRGSNLSSR